MSRSSHVSAEVAVLAPAERHAEVLRLDDTFDARLDPADDRCYVVLDVRRPGARSD